MLSELGSAFHGVYRTDDDARAVYSEAGGIARILPRGVAVPSTVDDTCAIVRWARETGTPLIPRGSGSSMSGGAVGDGMIVDLSRLDTIGDVDIVRTRVRVGPGALRGNVDAAARKNGLRFPPDPSSGAFCTIGGMVSTNAAGAHTLKYGPTRAWVRALECVFDDGSCATIARGAPAPTHVPAVRRMMEIADTLRARDTHVPAVHRGVRKDCSGYDIHAYAQSGELIDLLIGSEGTLALIVGVELMLANVPRATSSLLGAFASLEDAVTAAARARDTGAVACELLDRTFLDIAAQGTITQGAIMNRATVQEGTVDGPMLSHIPDNTEAVLLAEVEGSDPDDARHRAQALARAFTTSGATVVSLAFTPLDEHDLWELRHAASPMLAALGPSLQSMQFIEDGAVPPDALPSYVRGIRRIFEQYGIDGVIFGHAGDSHVHVNPLIDTGRSGWRDIVRQMLDDVVTLTANLHGTLTGEHGDGRLRTPLLGRVWPPEALEMFRMVKDAFDPRGIFNPGVKIPLPNQRPIDDIKYDPALPPLPPKAKAALDFVASQRAYHRFRLDLLDRVS